MRNQNDFGRGLNSQNQTLLTRIAHSNALFFSCIICFKITVVDSQMSEGTTAKLETVNART